MLGKSGSLYSIESLHSNILSAVYLYLILKSFCFSLFFEKKKNWKFLDIKSHIDLKEWNDELTPRRRKLSGDIYTTNEIESDLKSGRFFSLYRKSETSFKEKFKKKKLSKRKEEKEDDDEFVNMYMLYKYRGGSSSFGTRYMLCVWWYIGNQQPVFFFLCITNWLKTRDDWIDAIKKAELCAFE